MTHHSEGCLIGRYPIWFTDVLMSSANLIFILSTICGTRAVEAISCVQKSKLIETDSHECATIICLHTHSEKLKPIDHMLLNFAYA